MYGRLLQPQRLTNSGDSLGEPLDYNRPLVSEG